MLLEHPASLGGDGDVGARLALDEGLVDGDVAGLFKFAQVGAQVAVGDLQQVAQVREVYFIGRLQGDQGSHDAQAHRLVDSFVQFSHGSPSRADVHAEGDHPAAAQDRHPQVEDAGQQKVAD